MIIGRILSPVHSLGPGNRVCLWMQGCRQKCDGCISPELQSFNGTIIDETSLAKLVCQLAEMNNCSGITISGGEPFEQTDELLVFLKLIRNWFSDILVYTGFSKDELLNSAFGEKKKECLNYIDVLIDGRYIKELNTPECILRGSSNQHIYYLNEKIENIYADYMKKGRIIEPFICDNRTIVTGILNEVKK